MRSPSFQNLPIARKMQRMLAEAIFICCLFIAIFQIVLHIVTFRAEFNRTATRTAGIIAKNIEPAISFGDHEVAAKFLQTLSVDDSIDMAVVYDAEMKEFASHYSNLKSIPLPSIGNEPQGISVIGLKINVPIYSTDSVSPGKVLGGIFIKYKLSALLPKLVMAAIVLLTSFLLAFVAGRYSIRKNIPAITEPIEALTETATKIANFQLYDIQIPSDTSDEIGEMTRSFNEMIKQINLRDNDLLTAKATLEIEVDTRTQQLANQTQELKYLNKELQHFVSIMRHDLRAPMLNLTIYLNSIQEKVTDLAQMIHRYQTCIPSCDLDLVQIIQTDIGFSIDTNQMAITAINQMFNAVMDITAVGNLEIRIDNFKPGLLLDQVIECCAEKANKSGVSVRIGHLPASIVSDRDKVSQILAALIDNAIKFTAQSHIKNIWIKGDEDSVSWKLHVIDSGPGIPDYMREKIFDLFRRGDHEHCDGKGFGLAYAKSLANRLNAKILVDSEEGKGSTFSVIIFKPGL